MCKTYRSSIEGWPHQVVLTQSGLCTGGWPGAGQRTPKRHLSEKQSGVSGGGRYRHSFHSQIHGYRPACAPNGLRDFRGKSDPDAAPCRLYFTGHFRGWPIWILLLAEIKALAGMPEIDLCMLGLGNQHGKQLVLSREGELAENGFGRYQVWPDAVLLVIFTLLYCGPGLVISDSNGGGRLIFLFFFLLSISLFFFLCFCVLLSSGKVVMVTFIGFPWCELEVEQISGGSFSLVLEFLVALVDIQSCLWVNYIKDSPTG